GIRIEVKLSQLSEVKRGEKTKRWTWHHPYGTSGKKKYDRLVLVGEADPRVQAALPTGEPYVFFDIPFERVDDIYSGRGPIQITTDPRTVRAPRAKILFKEFAISIKQFESRYGILLNLTGSA
ncbi:MAG: hypothetical protein ACKVT0_15510, partial [Planctomycetaceae bacterium]